MKALGRRLEALERSAPDDRWRVVLDTLSDADLERLEEVLERLVSREAAIAELSDDDQRFLTRIEAMSEPA